MAVVATLGDMHRPPPYEPRWALFPLGCALVLFGVIFGGILGAIVGSATEPDGLFKELAVAADAFVGALIGGAAPLVVFIVLGVGRAVARRRDRRERRPYAPASGSSDRTSDGGSP